MDLAERHSHGFASPKSGGVELFRRPRPPLNAARSTDILQVIADEVLLALEYQFGLLSDYIPIAFSSSISRCSRFKRFSSNFHFQDA